MAIACPVCPVLRLDGAMETLIDATGVGRTLTSTERVCPSLETSICADPALTPVTRPVCETEATFGSELAQANVVSGRLLPNESCATAVIL
jgi:hypothetical protein